MGEEHRSESLEKRRVSRKTKRWILMLLSAAVVLTVGAGAGMHYTSQPNFCATCHEIKPHVVAWSTGPHNNVNCLKCHSNPGLYGYVSRKLAGLGEVYYHVTDQIPNPIEARFNIDTCKYCHTGKANYPGAKNITISSGPMAPRVSHQPMLAGNVSCLECHRNAGHGSKAD